MKEAAHAHGLIATQSGRREQQIRRIVPAMVQEVVILARSANLEA
jgi:hypothetical protein